MRIVSRKTLREFWLKHADAEQALKSWYADALAADWANPAEVTSALPYASLLENNRACFNIKGGNYRLVVKLNYKYRFIYIRFVGTHAEYDKIDATTI